MSEQKKEILSPRYLYLLRHAKSSWKYTELPDIERPLNNRGRKDIDVIARYLSRHNCSFDYVLASPSTRTVATARGVMGSFGYPLEHIAYSELLYESRYEQILHVIKAIPSRAHSALIVGHNPGLQQLASYLAGFDEPNLPTGSCVALQFTGKKWSDISPEFCSILFFERPRVQA